MTLEEVIEQLRVIRDTPSPTLVVSAPTQNGSLIFNELAKVYDEVREAVVQIDINSLALLPPHRKNVLLTAATALLGQLKRSREVKKETSITDDQQKNKYLRYFQENLPEGKGLRYQHDLSTIWEVCLEATTLLLRNELNKSSEPDTKGAELEILIQRTKSLEAEIESVLAAAKSALESTKEELGKQGVSKHSHIFETQAREYERQANFWLNRAIQLVALDAILVVVVLALVLWLPKEISVLVRIEVGVFGAVLISLASFAIVVCVRNYFAVKHNEIVNRHKANCLGTYNTFIDSADADRKAAVLLQATQTIFSHQRSGYLVKEAEVSTPFPVVEVVRHMPTPGATG